MQYLLTQRICGIPPSPITSIWARYRFMWVWYAILTCNNHLGRLYASNLEPPPRPPRALAQHRARLEAPCPQAAPIRDISQSILHTICFFEAVGSPCALSGLCLWAALWWLLALASPPSRIDRARQVGMMIRALPRLLRCQLRHRVPRCR